MTNVERTVLIEKLADLEHQQWVHWMDYLFSKCSKDHNGDFVISLADVNRWKIQMNTPYNMLSDEEKMSDREWAERAWDSVVTQSMRTPILGMSMRAKGE